MNRRLLILGALFVTAFLTLAACGTPAQPTAAPPTAAPAQPTAAPAQPTAAPAQPTTAPQPTAAPAQPTTAPQGGTVHVAIVNKDMSKDDIAAAIKQEGTVIVGNWTYTANDQLVAQFQKYVKDTYGVDVKLEYQATQSPSTYLTALYTALKAGNPAPYDVLAIEEPYYFDAKKNNAVDDVYPSGLITNWDRVDPFFRHDPQAVGFQSTATPAPIFHADKVGSWLKDWKDLADPRLKGRITMPLSGDITAGGFLIGTAWSLGKDYKDEKQMGEAIDFVCTKIHPNVLKYTTDSAEMQQLLRAGSIDVAGFWNSLARLEGLSGEAGTKDTTFTPMASGQAMMNGFMWVPKKASHPVLAQIFIEWRLRDDVQSPSDAWGITKSAWAELYEGPMGTSYVNNLPAWFTADYDKYFPKFDQIKATFKQIDWDYYSAHVDGWMKQYSKCAGG
jgi:spermidine/putrescine-binding protein